MASVTRVVISSAKEAALILTGRAESGTEGVLELSMGLSRAGIDGLSSREGVASIRRLSRGPTPISRICGSGCVCATVRCGELLSSSSGFRPTSTPRRSSRVGGVQGTRPWFRRRRLARGVGEAGLLRVDSSEDGACSDSSVCAVCLSTSASIPGISFCGSAGIRAGARPPVGRRRQQLSQPS